MHDKRFPRLHTQHKTHPSRLHKMLNKRFPQLHTQHNTQLQKIQCILHCAPAHTAQNTPKRSAQNAQYYAPYKRFPLLHRNLYSTKHTQVDCTKCTIGGFFNCTHSTAHSSKRYNASRYTRHIIARIL